MASKRTSSKSSPVTKKSVRPSRRVKFDLDEHTKSKKGRRNQSKRLKGILKRRKRQSKRVDRTRRAARSRSRSPSPSKGGRASRKAGKKSAGRSPERKASSGRGHEKKSQSNKLDGPTMEQLEQHRHHRRAGKQAKAFGRDMTGGIPVATVHRRMRHQHSVMGRFSRLGSGLLAFVARKTIEQLLMRAVASAKKDKEPTLRARHVLDAIKIDPDLNRIINLRM